MFYDEKKPYSQVEELILSCMDGTDLSIEKLKLMAQDIILGRGKLTGNTRDGTYRYEKDNTYNRIFEYIEKIQNKLKVSESEAKESMNLYLDLYDAVASKDPQNAQYDQNKELLEKIFPEKKCFFEDKPEQLDSVASEEKDSDDYGWLDPSGKFYPVEWGNHLSFAVKYVDDNFHSEFEEWSKKEKNCDREDFLIYSKGWILLHNPSTGIAFPTADPKHRTTKPQKEFLFDYYMKRNSPNKANMYYKDEN